MVNKEPEMLQKRSHFLNSVHEIMQVNSSVSTEQLCLDRSIMTLHC